MKKTIQFFTLLAVLVSTILALGQEPIGIFEDHFDTTTDMANGEATYDPETGEYIVKGSAVRLASGMVYGGHLVNSVFPVDSHIVLEAKIQAEHITTSNPWASALLEISENIQDHTQEPAFFSIGFSAEDQSLLGYFALTRGGSLAMPRKEANHDGRVKLVKEENWVSSYFFDLDHEEWIFFDEQYIDFNTPYIQVILYTGAGSEVGEYTLGRFTDVRLTVNGNIISTEISSNVKNWNLY